MRTATNSEAWGRRSGRDARQPWQAAAAVVVQDDTISGLHSIVVCPFTSELRSDIPMWRLDLVPNPQNGLMRNCQVMIDKIAAASPTELKRSIGRLTREEMDEISASLAVLLGLAT